MVKALQIATSQGQKIYTIDKTNISTVLPLISHDSGTISDIQNAVAAGKIVTVSQSKVTVNGWTGSGYIILDPTTGAGAYMIGGGADGGVITMPPAYAILFGLAAILVLAMLFVSSFVLALVLFIGALILAGCGLANYTQDGIWGDWTGYLVVSIIGGLALLAGPASGVAAFIIASIIGGAFIGTRFSTRCVEA